MQEDTASLSPSDRSFIEDEQVIDESEYAALLEQVQIVRTHVKGLSRPQDVDPWRFFAPYDRVKLRPGYVPDFVLTPYGGRFFGPGASTEIEKGLFTLTTRRVALQPQESEGARVIVMPPVELSLYPEKAFARMLAQQGLEGLVCERSASGFLQLALFCQEADRWHRNRFASMPLDSDWRWVCSAQRREAFVLTPAEPPYWGVPRGVSPEQGTLLRSADPRLRVRIHGDAAEVGGLAYSPWDGFAWLDCELTWPHRFCITRLEVLHIAGRSRPMF